ncbi:DUF2793 domain-containing protein [Tropicibacter oceani]|uniref:DUF2793 domain-containing protein n=1 Tax=Tropicibacter oceani TaxID=3058420 RepID=A0ABY8QPX5_9RHOB|nr:DUF2793 domain-containing protein [Tropicibacter oceani]WGW06061.1 DUF2793 domain-containing protein [Tropicibacter oceani]
MDISARLSLPYLLPSQAQKHVTHNAALERLDLLVQLTIEEFDASTPPSVPADGGIWALGAAPSGAWDGHADELAAWIDEAWVFVTPQTGWVATDKTGGGMRLRGAAGWEPLIPSAFDNLQGIGIGTSHDATNALAVASDATLLTNAGAGHQLKINKAGATDTASLLFQTGWSGRAEMGTAGSDNFEIKVSPDGSAWSNALSINAASSNIGFGTGTPNYPLHIHRPGSMGAALQLTNGNSGSGPSDGFWFGFSNKAYFWNYEALDTQFATSNTARMTIKADGKVGIGTATPSCGLEVAGAIRAASHASGARPSAASVGAGAMIYDTTLSKPLWSDGTAWRDAAGVAV